MRKWTEHFTLSSAADFEPFAAFWRLCGGAVNDAFVILYMEDKNEKKRYFICIGNADFNLYEWYVRLCFYGY